MYIVLGLTQDRRINAFIPQNENQLIPQLPEILRQLELAYGAATISDLINITYQTFLGETIEIPFDYLAVARQVYGIKQGWERYQVKFYDRDHEYSAEHVVGTNVYQVLMDAKVIARLNSRARARINSGLYSIERHIGGGAYEQVGNNNIAVAPFRYRVGPPIHTLLYSIAKYVPTHGWSITHSSVAVRAAFVVGLHIIFKHANADVTFVRLSSNELIGPVPQWAMCAARQLNVIRRNRGLVVSDNRLPVGNPATGQFDLMFGANAAQAEINMKLYSGTYGLPPNLNNEQSLYVEDVFVVDPTSSSTQLQRHTQDRNELIRSRIAEMNTTLQGSSEISYSPFREPILSRSNVPPAPRNEPPRPQWVRTANPQPLVIESVPNLELPPQMPDRRFGIEIEFDPGNHSQEEYQLAIDSVLRPQLNARVQCFGYHHSNGGSWDLKTDSSCGFELATPALRWHNWPVVENVLAAIRRVGGVATASCGVHIHHEFNDVRVTGLRRMYLLWYAYEDLLFKMVHPSRESNYYCAPIRHYGSFETLRTRMGTGTAIQQLSRSLGKYRSLNTLPWWNGTRIEVRMHHGTLDAHDVKFWTAITQQMVERSRLVQTYAPLQEIVEMSLSEQLVRFKRRYSLEQVLNPAIDAAMQRGVQNA